MSKEIDEKVVSMKFDNKHFMEHTSETISRLEKLKNSLRLPGAAKGLEDVGSAANNVKLNPLGAAAEQVALKFNALQVMATTALVNITNSAVNAGKRIVAAFTIDPIKTGLEEYETQINAVQTILANTSSKGTTLDQVNNALDELNHYADMTIYNFTEMTRNIGTFTAAGVDLDTSVSAIKGIANLAAVSGSTSQQASTAMYQLSQALAAGKVQLMDWNSVVNAGMGGQVFQDALKETARVDGIAIDDMIEKHGSFRETLQEGWLTSEVLTKTLAKFTGDLSEAQLKEMGYSEDQIKEIIKLGQTANDAATKVKTFTQLMDTLKEAAQSGWTQTWEILIGDFEEAKKLWTSVSDYFSEVLNKSAEARNNMLQTWADAGGRGMAIDSIKNIFQGLLSVITPIKEAFREIFPRTTSEQLLKITKSIKEFTSKLKLSDKTAANLKATFKGFFALIDIGLTVIKSVVSAASKLFGSVTSLGGGLLGVTGSLGNFIVGLRDSIKESGTFGNVLGKIAEILNTVFKRFIDVLSMIGKKLVAPGFQWFYKLLTGIWKVLQWIGGKIRDVLSNVASGLKEAFQNGDLKNATNLLSGGLLVAILIKLKKFVSNLKNPLEDLSGILDSVKGVFSSVGDALKAWQQELQAKTLLKIAGAIAILAGSILVISTIDQDRLTASLGAITALFAELMAAMAIFAKIAGTVNGVMKASVAMISMSVSILILAGALKAISTISWDDMGKSLLGLAATFAILLGALAIMSKIEKVGNGANKISTIAMSLLILAAALKILSSMSWEGVGKSLTAMAGVFAILLGALAIMSKFKATGVAGLIAMAIALNLLITPIAIIGRMNLVNIAKGLGALVVAIYALVGAAALMNGLIVGAAGMLILSAAMIGFSIALTALVPSLIAFNYIDMSKVCGGLLKLAGTILVLGLAALMAPMLLLMGVGLKALGAGLLALVPGFAALVLLDFAGLYASLLKFAGVLLLLSIISVVSPLIFILGASLMVLGAGAILVGPGLLAIAVGMTALATAMTASLSIIIDGLTAIIGSIIDFIPFVIEAIGKGIVLIAKAIGDSADAIEYAISALIIALCNAIIKSSPKIVEAVKVILDALIAICLEYIPKLVDAGIELITGLLNGIAQKIEDVIQAGVNLIAAFIQGIYNAIPKLIEAGNKAAIDLINGLADAIRRDTPLVIDAFNNLMSACAEAVGMYVGNFVEVGKQIVAGFVKGIKSSIGSVGSALLGGVQTAWGKVTGWLGLHSPSKRAADAGMNIDKGLAIGLNKYADVVNDASTDVAKGTSKSLTKALSDIPDILDSDAQPTIRPVLDLSDVEAGANDVDKLFGFNPVVGALSNANVISSSMSKNQNGNYDVLSAIKSLGKKLSDNTGNVYNINGVTYDDGSAVADAVGSLVRAARIERRI